MNEFTISFCGLTYRRRPDGRWMRFSDVLGEFVSIRPEQVDSGLVLAFTKSLLPVYGCSKCMLRIRSDDCNGAQCPVCGGPVNPKSKSRPLTGSGWKSYQKPKPIYKKKKNPKKSDSPTTKDVLKNSKVLICA